MGLLSQLLKTLSQPQPRVDVTISETEPHTRAKREFSDNDPTLMESIHSTDTYQPTQKLPFSDICPYCGAVQAKPIGRKKTCPDCKNAIYVRTTQDLFPSSALTKEQVAHVDFYTALRNVLLATKEDYLKHEKALQKQWNTKKVNTYDVLWSMFNDMELLQRSIDKSQEKRWALAEMFRNHQSTTLAAAEYQAARGHDPAPYLKSAHEYSLKIAKLDDSAKGLTVQSYSCCDACKKFHHKTFSLDFIEKNPVLPIKTCTRPSEDDSKFVLCTCSYQQYYEWE